MRYKNNICAGCGKMFNEGDDVVVCPVCGTPQHRECYEKNGKCVNEELHESGFSWQGEVTTPLSKENDEKKQQTKESEESLVCPTCGHENPPGSTFCEVCGQKFTLFGVNLLEKEMRLNREIDEEDKLKEEIQNVQETIYSGMGTSGDIERMIDARAKIVAPGLSSEQEQEIVCSHPIKRVLVFISSNAVSYLNKFRKIESTGSLTWNWAAFFFTPFWFFYRKLYKIGTIFLSIRLVISLLMLPFAEKFQSATNALLEAANNSAADAALTGAYESFLKASAPIYILGFLLIVLSVVSALIADRLYKKYVTEKLTESKQYTNPLMFSHFFLKSSAVNVLAALISVAVAYLVPNIVMLFIQ